MKYTSKLHYNQVGTGHDSASTQKTRTFQKHGPFAKTQYF